MKTKKAMKKITHIGMAALVAMGMLGTSCNKAESPEIETPETQKENIVTLTTTVGFAADGTKALTSAGVKTFAKGETMAIYYWKDKGTVHEKAVSAPLTTGDITNEGKSATFTFTLDNPYKEQNVAYVYPAAMANADFTPNYDALYNNQDGTLATLASNFDYCTKSGPWNGDNLPSLTLENQLAILAITLKDEAGTSDITSSITRMNLSDGTYTYNVNRSATAGPIYVAIRPTSDAAIDITATNGSDPYIKSLTGKTYAANNGYTVTWKMSDDASEAVDLGLSVKWAKMNVLATSESHYGQFFAWGETTGYGSNTADGHNFNWASYSLCGGSETALTKYNNKAGYGTVDNKTTLEAADDAATANWGSKWRMPTIGELNDLAATQMDENYTWTWTTVDGHNGYKITNNSTGANIFLPASGNRSGTSREEEGMYGYYFSSSLDTTDPPYCLVLELSSSYADQGWSYRYKGRSVRAVLKN